VDTTMMIILCDGMLHCVTVFGTVLQCVAVCCSVLWQRNIGLQHTATQFHTLQYTRPAAAAVAMTDTITQCNIP